MKCNYCEKKVIECDNIECKKDFKIGKKIWCVWNGCGHYCSKQCMEDDEAIAIMEVIEDNQKI